MARRAVRRLAPLAPLVVLLAGCAGAPAVRSAADLTNPALSPAHSQWLVGPVARLATPEEADAYLALASDAEAERFVEEFWRRRDPDPARPGNPVLQIFEARAGQADKRFSEAGYLGRRTDRGTTWVLYGEPAEITFETDSRPGAEPIEVWRYPADAARGLDGRRPDLYYAFTKRGDLTVLYRRPGELDRGLRRPRF